MGKQFKTNNDHIIERLSRWIKIKHNYSPNNRNSLAYYITDENGRYSNDKYFNPNNGLYLDYFNWNGRTWAINQFIILGGMMGGIPEMFTDTNGKLTVVGAYDSENYYDPIMIEIDEYGENVRVYRTIS